MRRASGGGGARRAWALAGLLLALGPAGCGLAQPQAGTVAPGAGRTVAPGAGRTVAAARFEVRARHTDVVEVEVLFPSDAAGRPERPPGGPGLPALLFVQGGGVSVEGYRWLAEEVARAGWVVALPVHPLDLAIFAVDNGRVARELLLAPPAGSLLEGLVDPARLTVGGHSLGGVVAVKLALQQQAGQAPVAAVALLASYPDPADAARLPSLAGTPTLALAAEGDCQAPLAVVRERSAVLPAPTVLAVVEGAAHFQFTGDDAPDAARGCASTLPLAEAHARIASALLTFLEAAVDGGGTGAEALEALPGVRVEAP
jgi:predicted dienelactone hydrolase